MKQKYNFITDKIHSFLSRFKVLSFFSRNNNYFKFGLLSLVVGFVLESIFSPKIVSFDFIKNKVQPNAEFNLTEFSNKGKFYHVKTGSETYVLKIFLSDVQDYTNQFKAMNIVLPQEEVSWFQKLKFNYFLDVFSYLGYVLLGLGVIDFFKYRMKSSSMAIDKERVFTRFKDVQGINNIKKELEEVVKHFQNSDKVKSYGGKVLTGVILHGPPGTGKTLMAKAVAGESSSKFLAVSGSQFVELYVGMGAKRVRELFEEARRNAPCVVFIDEIDAFAVKRGCSRSHSELDQTVNEILTQMDGFKDNTGVLVIAATNRLDNIDDALLRPGRFDRKIKVDLPPLEGRKDILKLYISKNDKISPDVDVERLAKATVGFSGADLKNLVDESIYLAIQKESSDITMKHFLEAKDKIIMGTVREFKLTEEDKKITAYHEVGHALVSYLKKVGTVSQVSIIPRGNALGVTQMVEEEVTSYSKLNLESRLMMLMGGKVAESVFCNHSSNGASNDLQRATEIARRMVCEWGMGKLGPVNVGYATEQYNFLSEQLKYEIDREVIEILSKAEANTKELLSQYSDKVKQLVSLLIEKEEISLVEIEQVFKIG
jgi:cell division protease FtsH